MGALRLRARAGRRDQCRDLPEQLAQGCRLRPRALRLGRRPLRGRNAACEGRGCAGRDRAAAARPHLRRSRRARRAGARLCRRAPGGAPRSGGGRGGGRPLHVHLHVRDDRSAQGLHDLEPQLLRHGGRRRRPRQLHRPRGHDAALPAARPQLRPADAPLRPVRRLHDRLPPRSTPGRGCACDRQADRLPERAARLREDPHRRRREVRRGDRRAAKADRLGPSRRPQRQHAPADRSPGAARRSRSSTGLPTSSSTQRSRAGSAAACERRSRAAHHSPWRSRSSSMRSTSCSWRDTG